MKGKTKLAYYGGALVAVTLIVIVQSITGKPIPWYTPLSWLAVWAFIEGIPALVRWRQDRVVE